MRLESHEALVIGHDDTRHPHVDLTANRIDPAWGLDSTGRPHPQLQRSCRLDGTVEPNQLQPAIETEQPYMPEEPLVVDPRMFITGPSRACGQCGQRQLGTLFVSDNVHVRRCRSCFHTEREPLPRLDKKLIYLDQMVLSEIAKKLDPVWREEKPRTDDFWLEAFDQIDRLVKLQLIVCPDSPIHKVESSFIEPYESVLRRLYEHLASGVGFRFPHEVLMLQMAEAFEAWSSERDPDWTRVARHRVVRGRLDRWSDRLRVSVNMGHWPGQVESRRRSRTRAHEILERYWKRWRSESQVSFEERFQAERGGLAGEALRCYAAYVERVHRAATGAEAVGDPQQLAPGSLVQLVHWVLSRLEERRVPREVRIQEAERFLNSEQAMSAPQNHLTALLYSGLARRAAHGQKRVPSRGTPNDIDFISAYLPYCDAMFIDKEFDLLLSEPPVAPRVTDHAAKIFSSRNRRDFLSYLAALEAEADPDHVNLVVRTYGEEWLQPYRSMLEHERGKSSPSP